MQNTTNFRSLKCVCVHCREYLSLSSVCKLTKRNRSIIWYNNIYTYVCVVQFISYINALCMRNLNLTTIITLYWTSRLKWCGGTPLLPSHIWLMIWYDMWKKGCIYIYLWSVLRKLIFNVPMLHIICVIKGIDRHVLCCDA